MWGVYNNNYYLMLQHEFQNKPLDDHAASIKCGYFLRAHVAIVAPYPDPQRITADDSE